MAFKDNFRIEKIYFQRVKDDALILERWKRDPRLYSDAEVATIAKNACDSILMLYKLVGECWNDNANAIEKVAAELDALKTTAEAYHDELNEKIDEVNNYLNAAIKDVEYRVTTIETKIREFGGLPSNEDANVGDVLVVGENGENEWAELEHPKKTYYLGGYILENATITNSNNVISPDVYDENANVITGVTIADVLNWYKLNICDVRFFNQYNVKTYEPLNYWRVSTGPNTYKDAVVFPIAVVDTSQIITGSWYAAPLLYIMSDGTFTFNQYGAVWIKSYIS